ncbi:MobQ family relaxase [Romboutsia sp.]|uniref:MobQ family relaxase n=1 Tax=Romboutsia sp. TaxID=1965302 RepID=UPI003F3B9B39
MAIYHFSVQIISRSNGSSSVGSSAYRSGEKLENERTGEVHDYTRKTGIEYTEILTPLNAPEWASDRANLWNEVEKIEKSKNSQLAREINIALPKELSLEKQIELTREFVKDTFVDQGMVADISIHDSKKGNPHAHIMLTMRPFENGEWGAKAKKEYILDKKGEKIKLKSGEYKSRKIDTVDWNKKENLEKWREQWAKYANKTLERNGIKEIIDHRTLAEQGIERVPQIHVGTHASAMEKRGLQSERGQLNNEIKELNTKLEYIDEESTKAITEFKEIKAEDKLKYRFVTTEEKTILEMAENIVKKPLDSKAIDSSKEKLNSVKIEVGSELSNLKYEPYSLREDIKLMKEWSKELKENKKELAELPKNIFGGYKDKTRASNLKSRIESKERALEIRGYRNKGSILVKEDTLKDIENKIDEINMKLKRINNQIEILNKSNKILDLKERREFYSEYKDQFPQSKYITVEGVRDIRAVNEYCGNKVDIDKINEIYLEKKAEFKLETNSGAKDILGMFEKAIKTISNIKRYDEQVQEKSQRQQERKKSKAKSNDTDIGYR